LSFDVNHARNSAVEFGTKAREWPRVWSSIGRSPRAETCVISDARCDGDEHLVGQVNAPQDLSMRPRSTLIDEYAEALPCTRSRRPLHRFRAQTRGNARNFMATLHLLTRQISRGESHAPSCPGAVRSTTRWSSSSIPKIDVDACRRSPPGRSHGDRSADRLNTEKPAAEAGSRFLVNSTITIDFESGRPGSNRRRPAWEAGILPTELRPHVRRETPRRQRTIEMHAGDSEDLAVAESAVNHRLSLLTSKRRTPLRCP
jgi:hypothetical protein